MALLIKPAINVFRKDFIDHLRSPPFRRHWEHVAEHGCFSVSVQTALRAVEEEERCFFNDKRDLEGTGKAHLVPATEPAVLALIVLVPFEYTKKVAAMEVTEDMYRQSVVGILREQKVPHLWRDMAHRLLLGQPVFLSSGLTRATYADLIAEVVNCGPAVSQLKCEYRHSATEYGIGVLQPRLQPRESATPPGYVTLQVDVMEAYVKCDYALRLFCPCDISYWRSRNVISNAKVGQFKPESKLMCCRYPSTMTLWILNKAFCVADQFDHLLTQMTLKLYSPQRAGAGGDAEAKAEGGVGSHDAEARAEGGGGLHDAEARAEGGGGS